MILTVMMVMMNFGALLILLILSLANAYLVCLHPVTQPRRPVSCLIPAFTMLCVSPTVQSASVSTEVVPDYAPDRASHLSQIKEESC